MSLADDFPEITKRNEPLAQYTHLKIGGPAEFLVQPRTTDELRDVLNACQSKKVPVRMLGAGHNLLLEAPATVRRERRGARGLPPACGGRSPVRARLLPSSAPCAATLESTP